MEGNNISNGNYAPNFNDFGLHDFINEPNFDQFIDLIRGESADNHQSVVNFSPEYSNCELMINNNVNCFVDYDQFGPTHGDLFGHITSTIAPTMSISDPNSLLSPLPIGIDYVDMINGGDKEEEGDNSSGTTTTTTTTTTTATGTPTKKTKVDRSRTLVSERRRRGRMKEKLYSLRALVPNITKMDKASIVGDAVLYVQELQKQAKRLKAEIAGLESSIIQGGGTHQGSVKTPKKIQLARNYFPFSKKILQMDMYQVEERGFYVRLVSNKGEGVAASLYKAIESLTSFTIQSSNLATLSDSFVLTFTMNARECGEGMNLPNLKLWITGALLNQGFELKSPV